jgi:Carboxypeptidase regulatory-like domain
MMLAAVLFLGSIHGVVADPEGAPLSHAAIQIYDSSNRAVMQAESRDDGTFDAVLKPGVYTIAIQFGYATQILNDVKVAKRLDVGKINLDLGGCD